MAGADITDDGYLTDDATLNNNYYAISTIGDFVTIKEDDTSCHDSHDNNDVINKEHART